MVGHVHPVVHDFLSLSAGTGVSSPGFRGLSIWVSSTAQGNYWRGQTEGSTGNNNTKLIMTQCNTVAWKWVPYHQGYHMAGNTVTVMWKSSTPPGEETHEVWIWFFFFKLHMTEARQVQLYPQETPQCEKLTCESTQLFSQISIYCIKHHIWMPSSVICLCCSYINIEYSRFDLFIKHN